MLFTLLIIINQLVSIIMLNTLILRMNLSQLPQMDKSLKSLTSFFERKVIKDQEAYILTEDLKEISEDHDLINPPISKTFNLKQKLIEKFGECIDFMWSRDGS